MSHKINLSPFSMSPFSPQALLSGTGGVDTGLLTGGNDEYYALGGNDLVAGGAGRDRLYGGDDDLFTLREKLAA